METREMHFTGVEFHGIFENQSPEWYALREGRIGGSEIGAVLGLSPWTSPLAVYYRLTGELTKDNGYNRRMRLGTLLEQPLLDLFQEEHPEWGVFKVGSYSPEAVPFLLANPDAFYTDENGELHLIEVKTSRDFWSEIPLHYMSQVQFYMHTFGVRHAKIVALTAGDYNEFDVEYDPFMAEAMLEALRGFYSDFEQGIRPQFDGSLSTYETMREIYPLSDDRTEIAQQLGIDLVNTAVEIDELTVKLNELKSRTLDQMGVSRVGYISVDDDEFIVARRQQKGEGKPFLIINKSKGK
jgi:putative phage-type endonuclease